MSHSAPAAVDEQLDQNFKRATQDGSFVSFHIKLDNEKFVQVAANSGTGNDAEDFKTMTKNAKEDEAAFFLFRLQGNKNWLLLTFVPDGVSVKDKMTYASCKGTLKSKLGFQFFVQEAHAVKLEELSYDSFKGSSKSQDSRSDFEKMHEAILQQEEEERTERGKASPTTGGYHSVTIPLGQTAKDHLQKFQSGEVNFVVLEITEDKSKVEASSSSTVSASDLSSQVNNKEPRFYLYAYQRPGGLPKVNFLIYCCPEMSSPKFRMVYSTAKPALAKELTAFGISLAPKKIEIREASELTESSLKDEVRSTPVQLTGRLQAGSHLDNAPALGGTTKARNLPTAEQHPIYSLMAGNKEGPSTGKKKIVIPPKGAW
jgi:hypothetical protein